MKRKRDHIPLSNVVFTRNNLTDEVMNVTGVLKHVDESSPNITLHVDKSVIVLGRRKCCDVVLDHPTVSRKQCTFSITDGVYITDEGSSNGTYVNNRRIFKKQKIKHGDTLSFGVDSSYVFYNYLESQIESANRQDV